MPVADLLGMHSTEALRITRNRALQQPSSNPFEELPGHSGTTTVRSLYDRKAADIEGNPVYRQLDGPIRSGSIDPVVLQPDSTRATNGHEVYEGAHRIVRAHQLGVTHLPVSTSWDSQKHYNEWDAD